MRLSDKAIKAIKENNKAKKELVYHLANTNSTMYRWLAENAENGMLTTYIAVEIIKHETGLTEKQILTK